MRCSACFKLAVWWLRLGINIQRIKPGQPQQNGRHERLHLTLKKEATRPAAFNFLQQLVGIREVDDHIWQVSFLEYYLGFFVRSRTG